MTVNNPEQQTYLEVHKYADTDMDRTSIHHTLGPGPNQAAPGSHHHDERYSPTQVWYPGDIKWTVVPVLLGGWLICDGAFEDQSTYGALFDAIGHTFNNGVDPGDGTFKKPDARNRALIGVSPTKDIGAVGGAETHTLTIDEMPSHNHPIIRGNGIGDAANRTVQSNVDVVSDGVTGLTGGGQPHNNMPPYLAVYVWIKT